MSFRLRLVASVAALLAAAVSTLASVPVVFNVVARTERLTGRLAEPLGARWAVRGACLSDGCLDPCTPGLESFDGRVELDPGASLRLERVGGGPLFAFVEAGEEGAGVGRLYRDETLERELGECVILRLDDLEKRRDEGQVVVLPFTAELEAGGELGVPAVARTPILLSAKVSLLRRSLLGDTFYPAGEMELNAGDRFVVERWREPARGFVRAGSGEGMTAVFRAQAREARVVRFGAGGFDLRASFADRLGKDPLILGLWSVAGFLLGFLALGGHKKDAEKEDAENETVDDNARDQEAKTP